MYSSSPGPDRTVSSSPLASMDAPNHSGQPIHSRVLRCIRQQITTRSRFHHQYYYSNHKAEFQCKFVGFALTTNSILSQRHAHPRKTGILDLEHPRFPRHPSYDDSIQCCLAIHHSSLPEQLLHLQRYVLRTSPPIYVFNLYRILSKCVIW